MTAIPVPAVSRVSVSHVTRRLAPWLAIAGILAGCATTPPPPPTPTVAPPTPTASSMPATYRPVAWNALPGWNDDAVNQAWPAFLAGCAALTASSSRQAIWQSVCSVGSLVDGSDAGAVRDFFENHFSAYAIAASDGKDQGLITGYYEPLLAGSREKSARATVPLYAPPDDLLTIDLTSLFPELKDKRVRGRVVGKRVVPYWSRADIDAGKASLADKVLLWAEEPVDAFFLEIQGSGRIRLADGSFVRVSYADQNGHPYRSIGRVLIDRGELTPGDATMQGIREWGRRNPDKLPALLDENPSYVFFREVPPPPPDSLKAAIDGPPGALGVPLLRERTIAVDPRSIPLGSPVFLSTTYPLSNRPLQRLVFAQDTGGAIKGAVRADFFWGFGDDAGRQAGKMRQQGQLWLLWPKGAALPKG